MTNPDTNAGVQSYTIHGGPDAALFEINATSGELSFQTTPDFESLQDANGDNLFEVIVRATDTANLFSDQTVYITLNDTSAKHPLLEGAIPSPYRKAPPPLPSSQYDRTFGGSGTEELVSIATPDGGYLFVGTSDSNATGDKSQASRGGKDFWAVKVDVAGNKIWDKRFGGSEEDLCYSVVPTSDGGYLLAGSSDSPADGDKSEESRGQEDMWIVKIDQNGTKLWDKRYGGNVEDSCNKIIQVNENGFLLVGASRSVIGGDNSQDRINKSKDFWAVRIDAPGDQTLG